MNISLSHIHNNGKTFTRQESFKPLSGFKARHTCGSVTLCFRHLKFMRVPAGEVSCMMKKRIQKRRIKSRLLYSCLKQLRRQPLCNYRVPGTIKRNTYIEFVKLLIKKFLTVWKRILDIQIWR